jgi:hypothetical protein
VAETEHRQKPQSTQNAIVDTVEMVKAYALQETVGPLRGAGRWIGFGLIGALMIGTGTAFLVLGVVRMFQTEWPDSFGGRWTKNLPYVFGVIVCLLVAALAMWRVNKEPLNKEKS